jgi:hypothetical protein
MTLMMMMMMMMMMHITHVSNICIHFQHPPITIASSRQMSSSLPGPLPMGGIISPFLSGGSSVFIHSLPPLHAAPPPTPPHGAPQEAGAGRVPALSEGEKAEKRRRDESEKRSSRRTKEQKSESEEDKADRLRRQKEQKARSRAAANLKDHD